MCVRGFNRIFYSMVKSFNDSWLFPQINCTVYIDYIYNLYTQSNEAVRWDAEQSSAGGAVLLFST